MTVEHYDRSGSIARLDQAKRHDDDRYDAVFNKIFGEVLVQEKTLAKERSVAQQALAELRPLPQAQRKLLIRNSDRFKGWAICQALIRESYRLGFSDPTASVEMAQLATEIGELVDPEPFGEPTLNDLKAAAWAQLGNALRVYSDLRSAEKAFRLATALLERGSGDPLEAARLQDLQASLRMAQSRFEDALEHLHEAVPLYCELEDHQLEARALIKLIPCYQELDRHEAAVAAGERALELLEAPSDTSLVAAVHANLIACLTAAGDYLEARRRLHRVRPLLLGSLDQIQCTRITWTEAKIARGLGQLNVAERLLEKVRARFIELGIPYDGALVSLELASLYAEQGRTVELKELVAEMLPIFRSREIHREATAALLLLDEAIRQEQAGQVLVDEVRSYLEKAQNNPELRFRRSAR